MSQNFSSKFFGKPAVSKPWMGLWLPVWVAAGFLLSQVLVDLLIIGLRTIGVQFGAINEATLQTVFSAIIYVVAILLVIVVPYLVWRIKTSRKELGVDSYVTWMDFVWMIVGFFVYLLISAIFTAIASHFPFYNVDQVQDTGFSQLNHGYEYLLAFATLVVIAPLCEELLFRGYLLGKLRKYLPTWISIIITSLLFGIVHLAWNVGVDVFALSLVLCVLRVTTGRLWPAVLLHALKNGVAFFVLFIYPLL